jgi:hypothetical protein
VVRYAPSRRYFSLALVASGGAVLSAFIGLRFPPSFIAAALFALTAVAVFVLALRPAIEIHETHLITGRKSIAWGDIRRVDQTGWTVPLAVHLTLADGQRLLLVYAGDVDSSVSLLRHIRRYSREALLDGITYRQFWGEPEPVAAAEDQKHLPPTRYPLLRPEDEEEVERMFQRLKSVGRLDPRNQDEK